MSAFKENLMVALHDAVRNFNESGDPNASVVKSAIAHDFNTDQTSRLLETFNTARTIYHYKTAADRTSQFQLADATVVIPELYKASKAEEKKSTFALSDYSDYDIQEADYTSGMVIEKAAGVQEMEQSEPVDHADTNLDAQSNQAYRIINVTRDLAKTARDEANASATAASIILSKLAQALKLGYDDAVLSRYSNIVNGYSDHNRLGPVVTKLAEHMPAWVKKATVELKDEVIDDRGLEPYIEAMTNAAEMMEVEAEMLAVADQMEKEADTFEAEWLSIVLPTFPESKAASVVDLIVTDRLQKSAQTTTTSKRETVDLFGMPKTITTNSETKPMLGEAITSGIGKGVETNLADLVSGLGTAFSEPREAANKKLSDRLKNTQRQIMLEELMTTDPVLSTESPETVANAYRAVLSLAPDVASNKEVVRAILRQAVHSVAISPYEAESWTGLEKNIRQLTGKMPQAKPEQGAKGGKR